VASSWWVYCESAFRVKTSCGGYSECASKVLATPLVNSLFTAKLPRTLRSDSQSGFNLVGSLRPYSECRGQAAEHLKGGTRSLPLHLSGSLQPHSLSIPKVVATPRVNSLFTAKVPSTLQPYSLSTLKLLVSLARYPRVTQPARPRGCTARSRSRG
jgi:hypothetical protein